MTRPADVRDGVFPAAEVQQAMVRGLAMAMARLKLATDAVGQHAEDIERALTDALDGPAAAVIGSLRTELGKRDHEYAAVVHERDDYAARLKATDQEYTKVAAERDAYRDQAERWHAEARRQTEHRDKNYHWAARAEDRADKLQGQLDAAENIIVGLRASLNVATAARNISEGQS